MLIVKMDKKFYGEIRKAKNDTVVPEDEWILFLVKDTAFANILPLYRLECIKLHADRRQIVLVEEMIKRVQAWRANNPEKCKVPDAEGEKLLT